MSRPAAPPFTFPWQNRKGEFSRLKAVALAAVLAPALWIAFRLATGQMGAKPIDAALHETGSWAVRLLIATLAVTPYRLITGDNRVIAIRRMLGVAALAYTLAHLALYVVQQRYDLVAVTLEIIKRFYLTIGFVAVLMLVALGSTSFDSAVRRLGAEAWNRLHRLVWPSVVLAVLHAFIQSKIDISEKAIEAGLVLALVGVRLMRGRVAYGAFPLLVLAGLAGLVTVAIEFLWYASFTGVPAARILAANLMLDLQPRPGLAVFLIVLVLPILAQLPRRNASARERLRATPAAASKG
jgi:sulfoxide reductase heme-binding subunit YedZ